MSQIVFTVTLSTSDIVDAGRLKLIAEGIESKVLDTAVDNSPGYAGRVRTVAYPGDGERPVYL